MPKATGYPRDKKLGSARMKRLTARAKELLSEAKTHRQTTRETAWNKAERLYRGKHWGDNQSAIENDLITVNYAGSTINTIIPFVAANPPQFRVDPLGGEATIARAREQTAWLNRWWRSNEVDGAKTLKDVLFDYLVYGNGYFLPTYEMIEEADTESAFADKTRVKLAMERVDPWDVWLDVYERWVIRRFLMSVEELKQDKRYHGTANLRGSNVDEERTREGAPAFTGRTHERDQLVEVYEFYDLVTDELLVFCDQLDQPLRFVEGLKLPLVPMANYRIPGQPYAMGELEQIEGIQYELNKARSQMVTHRRRNVQKFAARTGALDPAAKSALRSEVVNDVVEIDDRGQDLKDLIFPLQVPLLSPDAYNSYEISKGDMFEITGISEYLRGGTPSGRRTATEASIIEGSNNVKTAHKLAAVEDALQKAGQLVIEIAREVFPLTETDEVGAMIVTGREAQGLAAAGAINGVPREAASQVEAASIDPAANDGAMWQGEYQVFVEAASTELRDPFIRAQKFRALFESVLGALPVLQAQGINPDLRKMLELWFEAEGVEDFEAIFGSAPPPQRSPEQLSAIQQGGNALSGTQPGQPELGNIGAPADLPSAANSGLLG